MTYDGPGARVLRLVEERTGKAIHVEPGVALKSCLGMNAAFSRFWAKALNLPQITLPYRAAGYEKLGLSLLDVWDGCPRDAEDDNSLADGWASVLGMSSWYRWIPEVVA